MKKISLLAVLVMPAFFFTGCKKSSGNSPVAPSSADSYLPVTAGSSWDYYAQVAGYTDTISIKMTGSTTRINGADFFTATGVSHFNKTIVENFYEANHLYVERYTIGGDIYATNIDVVLLNDSLAVGHSFTAAVTTIGGVDVPLMRIINTTVEKNITKVVGGQSFSGVIHTRVDLQYNTGSGFETNSIYDYFMAKGIGIIEMDSSVPGGAVDETQTIMNYTVK
ncbi:hypothetical protein [Mucilaginibacter sp.]|uniref:hypothetical protein n=1 Tax=Mucilaginibacter sp. TaxID=1882438 RepID=UPI00284AA800|nr:hypothetical protein [Mucilaginibacter sp.]MDR3695690.1 hypothetical protein [Mucilaginibacter sp.]